MKTVPSVVKKIAAKLYELTGKKPVITWKHNDDLIYCNFNFENKKKKHGKHK